MDTQTVIRGVGIGYKVLKWGSKIYSKFKNIPPSGLWCACWQVDDEKKDLYENGTMMLYRINKKITGEIYSGDRMWPVSGNYKNGIVDCDFYHTGEKGRGHFEIKFANGGKNDKRMKGSWSGVVEKDIHIKKVSELRFFAAKNGCCDANCFVTRVDLKQKNCRKK